MSPLPISQTGPQVSDEEAFKHISTIDKNEDLVSFIKGYLANNRHRVKEEEQTSAQVFREGTNWLSANIDYNMVMMSWCGGASDNTEAGINIYLNKLNELKLL